MFHVGVFVEFFLFSQFVRELSVVHTCQPVRLFASPVSHLQEQLRLAKGLSAASTAPKAKHFEAPRSAPPAEAVKGDNGAHAGDDPLLKRMQEQNPHHFDKVTGEEI